jgi:hypothetical protein
MICFAKSGLTEDLYIVHKEEFSITCYMCEGTLDERPSIFIRDKLFLSSERMLHNVYGCKCSVTKSGREPRGAWRQDELIGGKPPVVK